MLRQGFGRPFWQAAGMAAKLPAAIPSACQNVLPAELRAGPPPRVTSLGEGGEQQQLPKSVNRRLR